MIKSYIEEIKMNHPDKVKKFCSYHIKQFMLQQFDTWQEGEINSILRRLVSVLIDNLSSSPPHIYSYFIENDTLYLIYVINSNFDWLALIGNTGK
jgi:hypothetical protein